MNTRMLQRSLDRLLATTGQRFLLSFLLVATAVIPSLLITRRTGVPDGWIVGLVALLAILVVVEPDEQLAAILSGITALQWLTIDVPLSSPTVPIFATAVLAVHTLAALLAATPHNAVVGRAVLARWAQRSGVAVGAMLVVWVSVRLLATAELGGSVIGTTTALVVLILAALTFRRQLLTP